MTREELAKAAARMREQYDARLRELEDYGQEKQYEIMSRLEARRKAVQEIITPWREEIATRIERKSRWKFW